MRYARALSALTALEAFFTEHRRLRDLDAGIEGSVLWTACDCGASMASQFDEDE